MSDETGDGQENIDDDAAGGFPPLTQECYNIGWVECPGTGTVGVALNLVWTMAPGTKTCSVGGFGYMLLQEGEPLPYDPSVIWGNLTIENGMKNFTLYGSGGFKRKTGLAGLSAQFSIGPDGSGDIIELQLKNQQGGVCRAENGPASYANCCNREGDCD